MQQQGESKSAQQPERDGEEDEHQRVADRDAEDLVVPEIAEVLQAHEARAPDQVVLRERERERDQRRKSNEEPDPEQVRRQHERVLAALAIAKHQLRVSPVSASNRYASAELARTPTVEPTGGRTSAPTRATTGNFPACRCR